MKKTYNSSSKIIGLGGALFLCLSTGLFAQENKQAEKAEKQEKVEKTEVVRIKIIKDENGKITKTDTTISTIGRMPSQGILNYKFDIKGLPSKCRKGMVVIDEHGTSLPEMPELPDLPELRELPAMPGMSKSFFGRNGKMVAIDKSQLSPEEAARLDEFLKELPAKAVMNDSFMVMPFMNFSADSHVKMIHIEQRINRTGRDKKCSQINENRTIIFNIEIKDPKKKDLSILEKSQPQGMTLDMKNPLPVEDLNFYPNPNNGKFQLNFKLENKGNTMLKILDITGKEIYKESLDDFSGKYSHEMDISNHGKGVFLLQITQDKQAFIKKIVVN